MQRLAIHRQIKWLMIDKVQHLKPSLAPFPFCYTNEQSVTQNTQLRQYVFSNT